MIWTMLSAGVRLDQWTTRAEQFGPGSQKMETHYKTSNCCCGETMSLRSTAARHYGCRPVQPTSPSVGLESPGGAPVSSYCLSRHTTWPRSSTRPLTAFCCIVCECAVAILYPAWLLYYRFSQPRVNLQWRLVPGYWNRWNPYHKAFLRS